MNNENIQTPPEAQPASSIPPPAQPIIPAAPGPSGRAIATLILGILSLICCGFFCGIPAIILGKQELNAIKEGRSNPEGHAITQVGFILGIVGTVLSCLGALVYAAILIFGISLSIMEGIQEGAYNL